ncbi:MAG TPA: DUF3667 domain-containing protein [Pyrinomonadaceae bacterium]|nr:DUF3667 domain-containing protein [Pyrinomonadaceae bacterium]
MTTEANQLTERCPNCESTLTGEYCQKCGQKKIHSHDFAVTHFFGHVVHEFTHLDSNKAQRTFTSLLFRPGLLTHEYWAGRKGRYIQPLRIYLTFSALYFLFAWGALSDIRGGGVQGLSQSPMVVRMAQQKGIAPSALAEKVQQKAEKYSAGLRFGSVLISGVFLSLLYFRRKKYYVEHLIFSLHFYSFDFFCKSVFALLFILAAALGTKLPTQVLNLFYPTALVYLIFALRRVYKQSWPKTLLKSVILFVCETLLFIAVNMAGFIIAFNLV